MRMTDSLIIRWEGEGVVIYTWLSPTTYHSKHDRQMKEWDRVALCMWPLPRTTREHKAPSVVLTTVAGRSPRRTTG
jgi:hypothetical protein